MRIALAIPDLRRPVLQVILPGEFCSVHPVSAASPAGRPSRLRGRAGALCARPGAQERPGQRAPCSVGSPHPPTPPAQEPAPRGWAARTHPGPRARPLVSRASGRGPERAHDILRPVRRPGEEAREPEQERGASLAISADRSRPAPGPWLNPEPPLSVPRSSADPWCPEAAASDIPAFWERPRRRPSRGFPPPLPPRSHLDTWTLGTSVATLERGAPPPLF